MQCASGNHCEHTSSGAPAAPQPSAASYWIESAPLLVPPLPLLAARIQAALEPFYAHSKVETQQCPDFRAELGLSAAGICGDCAMVDVGGVPNLLDPKFHSARFSLRTIAKQIGLPNATFIGAGATSKCIIGHNAEFMPCDNLGSEVCRSMYADVVSSTGAHKVADYNHEEFGLLCNMLASKGERGQVIHVTLRGAKEDKDNPFKYIRLGLMGDLEPSKNQFALPDEKTSGSMSPQIGLGGVMLVQSGRIRSHVMPDFKPTVMVEGPEVDDWLKFYQVEPDLICLSTLVTGDPTGGALNLRVEHTHFFSRDRVSSGGHYHYGLSKDDMAYEGWFVPCSVVHRVENAFRRDHCHPQTWSRPSAL